MENQNKTLKYIDREKKTMQKHKISLTKFSGWTILSLGIISIIIAVFYNSQILAFIGLGLTFWGIILTYIQDENYIKESLLSPTTLATLSTINQIIEELNYKGKAVYLPPKYLKNLEDNSAYIPKNETENIPSPEQIQEKQSQFFIENPEGILITPPGSELTKLFEEKLGKNFTQVDLKYVELNLPKLLIDDLEIAKDLEIKVEAGKIHVKIENSNFQKLTEETTKLPKIHSNLGCPLTSAIACAIAKATGKPVTIEKEKTNEEDKTLEVEYNLLEERIQ